MQDRPAITVQVLPPERRRRSQTIAACGCCCCCCCLHTAGGLIGAATGSWMKRPLDSDPEPTEEEVRDRLASGRASSIYWWLLGVFSLPVLAFYEPRRLIEGFLVLLLAVPVMQLGASLVTLTIVGFGMRAGKGAAMRRIGRITWRGLLGALIGLGVMYALFKGLGRN